MNTAGVAKYLSKIPWYGWGGIGVLIALATSKKGQAATPAKPPTVDPGAPKGGPQPTIKLGSTGETVKLWQGIVGVYGSGTFDAATKTATIAWQTVHGLTADGIVGKMTWYTAGYYDASNPPIVSAPKPSGGGGANAMPNGPIGASGGSGSDYNPFGLSEDIAEREEQILHFASQGLVDNTWEPLVFSGNSHSVTVYVSKRALALQQGGDRYTFNMSYKNAFKLAELLGGVFLTTKMSDALAKDSSAKKLGATMATSSNDGTIRPWSQDGTMAKTYRMNEQAARLNDLVGDFNGPVVNEGKDWVQSRRDWPPDAGGINYIANRSTNFGWYPGGSKSPGGMSVVQSIGKTHDINHTDYSQLVRIAKREVILDGQPTDIAVVLADPALSALLQDEGGVIPDTTPPALQGIT